MIARVAVDLALDRIFDYSVPADISSSIEVGRRVRVPFGRTEALGYVVGLVETSEVPKLKPVSRLVDDKPVLTPAVLRLAEWIADYYCATVEQAIRTVLPGAVRKAGARFRQQVEVSLVDGQAIVGTTAQGVTSAKRDAVIQFLRVHGSVSVVRVMKELGISMAPLKTLAKRGVVRLASAAVRRDPLARREILRTDPLELTPEQRAALETILGVVERQVERRGGRAQKESDPHAVLLFGVTGSGKTEVYLQAIAHVLSKGMGAIVLVPEISLTPQTVERFVGRFGQRVAVLHSNLSEGERHDEWHRIRDGKADIVIGARSAVFAPVANLGLIVVDEEHEPTYKQDEAPRYNARDVAVMRGRLENCAVVLGTATPALESWRNATTGKYLVSRLAHRADNRRLPTIRIVDMRNAAAGGRGSVFSSDLVEAMHRRLDRAEQTMLFLNRRGFATSLVCLRCGFVARCDHCSVSCTYHRDADALLCHICGAARKVPPRCPGCQDPAFKYSGVGTQRVESVLGKLFPKARIQRMDTDVTGTKGAHDRILGEFRAGRIDILIGTQMIAKGLHFPNVTLVGVIYADLSLHMPDFRAGERTFQLLAQVAGRCGRGEVPGEVLVQTYTPFHPAVQLARRLDYEGFSDQEMEFRKELSYPPFSHLVCLTFKGKSEARVSFTATSVLRRLRPAMPENVTVAGPSPAPLARAKGFYRYQIMLRAPSVVRMTQGVRKALADCDMPADIHCAVDVDAVSLM